ncbi:hypothetical protein MASR2M79_04740 [Aminivibrio sp.]
MIWQSERTGQRALNTVSDGEVKDGDPYYCFMNGATTLVAAADEATVYEDI